MGKFFVPPTAHTPADRLREALDRAERRVSNLRGAGPQAMEIVYLFDQIAEGLAALDENGADVRSERARFETLQRQLRGRKRQFLHAISNSAGLPFIFNSASLPFIFNSASLPFIFNSASLPSMREERAAVQPEQTHWWWFLDEEAARQRKTRLRRTLTWGLAAIVALVVAGLAYNHFLAPPPEVREAFRHTNRAESLIEQGDLQEALSEFESAAALNPNDPIPWLWQGALHVELDEQETYAQDAFEKARSLYGSDVAFLVERAMAHLQLGNVAAAGAVIEQAIALDPQAGQVYYVRGAVFTEQGEYDDAIADLEHAAELASTAGDVQLEAAARAQRATVIQMQAYGQPTISP